MAIFCNNIKHAIITREAEQEGQSTPQNHLNMHVLIIAYGKMLAILILCTVEFAKW